MAEGLDPKVEELVLKNIRLVYYIAQKYLGTYNDLEELASIGKIGIIKAAQSYDESKGIKFATYASRCISNEILMFLRKQKVNVSIISLDEAINVDSQGNELTLRDVIPASSSDFTEEIAEREVFIRFINIVLNLLEPRERLIMLYKIADITQRYIAKTLNISQSYISRLEKRLCQKVKSYLTKEQQFKEFFSMTINNDSYKISFSSKDVKNFNKIFATCLQNLTSDLALPDFNVNCNKERIVILLPAEPESFSFIAQIIQEIDIFNMTFVSDKNIDSLDDDEAGTDAIESPENLNPKAISKISKTATIVDVSDKIDDNSSKIIDNSNETITDSNVEKKESCAQQIINYISHLNNFSTNQINQQFPEIPYNTMAAALRFAKRKGLIKSTTRGNYEVISNKDNTQED